MANIKTNTQETRTLSSKAIIELAYATLGKAAAITEKICGNPITSSDNASIANLQIYLGCLQSYAASVGNAFDKFLEVGFTNYDLELAMRDAYTYSDRYGKKAAVIELCGKKAPASIIEAYIKVGGIHDICDASGFADALKMSKDRLASRAISPRNYTEAFSAKKGSLFINAEQLVDTGIFRRDDLIRACETGMPLNEDWQALVEHYQRYKNENLRKEEAECEKALRGKAC